MIQRGDVQNVSEALNGGCLRMKRKNSSRRNCLVAGLHLYQCGTGERRKHATSVARKPHKGEQAMGNSNSRAENSRKRLKSLGLPTQSVREEREEREHCRSRKSRKVYLKHKNKTIRVCSSCGVELPNKEK